MGRLEDVIRAFGAMFVAGVILSCASDDRDNSQEAAPSDAGEAAPPPPQTNEGRFGGGGVDAGTPKPSCGHSACASFDGDDWMGPWDRIIIGTGASIGQAKLHDPPSKPAALRGSVQRLGERAFLAGALPWQIEGGSRAVKMEVKLYLEQSDAKKALLTFAVSGGRQTIAIVANDAGQLSIEETDNRTERTMLKECPELGTLPLATWTRVVATVEGRTASAAGSLTMSVGDAAPQKCELGSTEISPNISLYVGLLALESGQNIVHYDDLLIDVAR